MLLELVTETSYLPIEEGCRSISNNGFVHYSDFLSMSSWRCSGYLHTLPDKQI